MRALILDLVWLAAAGCGFSIDFSNVRCGTGGLCPDGLRCQTSTNMCVEVPTGGTKELGETCGAPSDCLSTYCADGVCCNAECDGQCEQCSAQGQCQAVTGDPQGARAACTGGGTVCAGSCDGTNRLTCTYQTVECRAAGCSGTTFNTAASCSLGTCPEGTPQDCATTPNTKYCTARGCLGVDQLAVGYDFTCALMSDATVMCWGQNDYGQLGQGNTTGGQPDVEYRFRPVHVPGLTDVTKISIGGSDNADGHVCAVKTDKTVECWGSNPFGELGRGAVSVPQFGPNPTPMPIKQNSSTVFQNVNDVAAGQYHLCLVDTSNRVWCVGLNLGGRLGDNSITDRLFPVQAGAFTDFGAIWAGYEHTCATIGRTNGTSLRCWGVNGSFQAGVTPNSNVLTPTTAAGFSNINATLEQPVGAGFATSCAIANNSVLNCWGYNGRGQLGKGCNSGGSDGNGGTCTAVPPTHLASPVCRNASCTLAGSMRQTTSFAVGEQSACAVSEGALYCWGNNSHGEFGDGTMSASYFGKVIPGAGVPVQVVQSGYHTCVRYADRTIKCAGWNCCGQIGNGDESGGDVTTFVPPTF